jgi:hypothetical protein
MSDTNHNKLPAPLVEMGEEEEHAFFLAVKKKLEENR